MTVQFLDKTMAVLVLPDAIVLIYLVTCSLVLMLARELQFPYGTFELTCAETLVVTGSVFGNHLPPCVSTAWLRQNVSCNGGAMHYATRNGQ